MLILHVQVHSICHKYKTMCSENNWNMISIIHSFIHSFLCLFVRSFIHAFIHPFIHSGLCSKGVQVPQVTNFYLWATR